ncbi:MAG: iron chaperone [Candidatus Dormibacteraceae bacterium]
MLASRSGFTGEAAAYARLRDVRLWGPAELARLELEVRQPAFCGRSECGGMDDAVRTYIDAIAPEYRPLFDRIHRLVLETCPDATVVLSYQVPTYRVGRRQLFVGVWKHGVSIYGWGQGRDGGFIDRHSELRTGKGTIQLRPEDAATIPDGELRDLVRAALDG